MNKTCNNCGIEKSPESFQIGNNFGRKYEFKTCKKCRLKIIYAKDKDKIDKISNKTQAVMRQRVIIALGGKCVWCGYGNPIALQIDHVNGGGSKLRRGGQSWYRFYKEVIEGTHEHPVQLLCANCNFIKRHNENEF